MNELVSIQRRQTQSRIVVISDSPKRAMGRATSKDIRWMGT